MRLVKIATGMAMVLSLTLAPLDAAPKGPKGPSSVKASSTKAPKVAKTITAPKAPKPTAPKTTKAPKVTTAKVTSAPKTKAPKTTTKADTKLAKAEVKSAKKAGTTSTTTIPTTTTATTIDFTKGAVAERLAKNSNLRTKLESRLLAAGYDGTVYQAAYGFKNQGQFVAATNVARNTGASFEQLKLQMTGLSVDADGVVLKANLGADGTTVTMVDPADVTNPAPTKSLGQAIKTVKSSVDATAAAQTATTQADAEIAATSTVSN